MDVIMDVTDYMKKAERQLNNKDHFSQPSKNQTAANNETAMLLKGLKRKI